MKLKIFVFFVCCALLPIFFLNAEEATSKVVLVTGASRGIGLKTCEAFAEMGYTVYGTLRESSQLDPFNALQERFPGKVHSLFMDLTDEKSINRGVAELICLEGKVDVLVNNAGILLFGALESCEMAKIKKQFEVNFFGVIRVLQAVLPHMRKAEKGRIINVGSRSGFRPAPSLSTYAATKFALEAITETMAFNLEPWNIKISIIEPGPVNTEMDIFAQKGTRYGEKDPYLPYFEEAGLLLDDGMATAQPVEEVAAQILDIAEDPSPNLRYQTSELVRKQAAMIWVDPTGNINLQSLKDGLTGE